MKHTAGTNFHFVAEKYSREEDCAPADSGPRPDKYVGKDRHTFGYDRGAIDIGMRTLGAAILRRGTKKLQDLCKGKVRIGRF